VGAEVEEEVHSDRSAGATCPSQLPAASRLVSSPADFASSPATKTQHQISTIRKQSQHEIEAGIRARCARTERGVPTCGPVITCSDACDEGRRLWLVSNFGDASRGLATPRPVSAASASSWRSGAEALRSWPGRPLKAR
jgi:hypothetical protein